MDIAEQKRLLGGGGGQRLWNSLISALISWSFIGASPRPAEEPFENLLRGGFTEGHWYLSRPTQPGVGHSFSRYLLSAYWASVPVALAEDQSKVPATMGCTLG